jgi:sugar-specific transcriptional regulator TrmB
MNLEAELTEEGLLRNLQYFGLSNIEACIFIRLLKTGSEDTTSVSRSLDLGQLKTYRALRKLMNKGLVETMAGRPKKYFAVTIKNALDLLTEDLKNKLNDLEKKRPLLEQQFGKVLSKNEENHLNTFRIIQRRDNIYRFGNNLFRSASREICTMGPPKGIIISIRMDGDSVLEECVRRGVSVRKIVDIDENNVAAAGRFLDFCELRHLSGHSARLVLVDETDVITYLLHDDSGNTRLNSDVAVWTNNKDFITMMKDFFEISWNLATDGRQRIRELESGRIDIQHPHISCF